MAGFYVCRLRQTVLRFIYSASPARRKLGARKSEIAQGAIVEVGDFRKRSAPAHVVPEHPDQ